MLARTRALLLAFLAACASAHEPPSKAARPELPRPAGDPPSRPPAPPVLIKGGTVLTAAGARIEDGAVLLTDGKIAQVGKSAEVTPPEGARVIDAQGRFVTPGLVDTHSHLGVYAAPFTGSHADGNEIGMPNTADVWAEHGFWPQDPQIPRAIAGGVTTILVLPGSGNLFGGRGQVMKLHLGRQARDMRFPGARQSLKMACGENPKRVYGQERGGLPSSRMGNVAGYRGVFQAAAEYKKRWEKWEQDYEKAEAGKEPDPPPRDLKLETVAGVLRGEILVQNHCYRADEMLLMLDLAQEFGYQIRSFHHALEAYKIADVLAARGVAVSTWADWWGFKMEAFDGIRENLAMVQAAGGRAVVHSDSGDGIQRLNQEAAKGMAAGLAGGLAVTEDQALRWITANPAWVLGVDERAGTLEPGKMADVVVWSAHPFSVLAQADEVFVDGELVYDRLDPAVRPRTDFTVGISADEVGR